MVAIFLDSRIQYPSVDGVTRALWVTTRLEQQPSLASDGKRRGLHGQTTVSDGSVRNHAREHGADRTARRVRPAP